MRVSGQQGAAVRLGDAVVGRSEVGDRYAVAFGQPDQRLAALHRVGQVIRGVSGGDEAGACWCGGGWVLLDDDDSGRYHCCGHGG